MPTRTGDPTPSTSTPATASERRTVRAKAQDLLTAWHPAQAQRVVLPSGYSIYAAIGDWIVANGERIVDVVPPDQFDRCYEFVSQSLTLPDKARADLDRVLGLGATHSANDLVFAVDRLARLQIGEIVVELTPPQWEELKKRAAVQNQPVRVFMERLVAKFTQDLWSL